MPDPKPTQAVAQLQAPRTASDDDDLVPARRERLIISVSHVGVQLTQAVVCFSLRASPCSKRNMMRGCFVRKPCS